MAHALESHPHRRQPWPIPGSRRSTAIGARPAAARRCRGGADIDPLDLGFCIGWICLADVVEPGPRRRFRFRLDDSRLTQLTGMDLTGRHADELPDRQYRDFVTAIYDRVVTTRAPLFIANTAHWLDRGYRVEQVALPWSNDGITVTGIMDMTLPALASIDTAAGLQFAAEFGVAPAE